MIGKHRFGKRSLLISGAILVLAAGCAVIRTRQFILVPAQADRNLEVGGWHILNPRVVAFRGVVKLSTIPDTNLFYLSFQAKRNKKTDKHTDLLIDSAEFQYCMLTLYPPDRPETPAKTGQSRNTEYKDCSYRLLPKDTSGPNPLYGRVDTTEVSEWRHVTRTQQNSLSEWDYFQKEFDFFGDQGLRIPLEIKRLQVSFDAIVFDSVDGSRTTIPLTLRFQREEDSTRLPFRAQ